MLQDILNPDNSNKNKLQTHLYTFREGDKIMQLKNNYDKNVFNGDTGKIIKIDPEEKQILAEFQGIDGICSVLYEITELDEITLAYACSVHKSQGSEYTCIIMPITTQHYIMLNKNLIYTAVTRAKKSVILIGTLNALNIGIKNKDTDKRHTKLTQRIKELF